MRCQVYYHINYILIIKGKEKKKKIKYPPKNIFELKNIKRNIIIPYKIVYM